MIGTVEQAIIDRLKLANENDVFGYKIREIDSYGGQINDDVDSHIRSFPAIWVTYNGASVNKKLNTGVYHNHKFWIIVAAKSLRNEAEARRGSSTGDVGAYQLIRDIISLLHGFQPVQNKTNGIVIGNIQPLAVSNKRKHQAAIYAIDVGVVFGIEAIESQTLPDSPLTAIHTNYDLPPLKISGALPDDANADATSHTTGD